MPKLYTENTLRLFLSVVNISFSFFVIWYILFLYGASERTDLLFLIIAIFEFIKSVLVANITNVLTPKIIHIMKTQEHYKYIFFKLFYIFVIIFVIVILALLIFMPFILPIYLQNTSSLFVELSKKIFYFQIFSFFFSMINSILFSKINAEKKYIYGDLALIFGGVLSVFIISLYGNEYGIIAVVWAFLFKEIAIAFLIFPYKEWIGLDKDKRRITDINLLLKEIWIQFKPLLVSSSYYKTEILIDRFLLSFAKVGQLSLYLFSYQIVAGTMIVLQRIVKVPMLTHFSQLKNSDIGTDYIYKDFNSIVKKTLFTVLFLYILFFLIGKWFLNVIPEFGQLNYDNITHIWSLIMMLSGVFIGGVLGYITTSVFHAFGRTRLLAKTSVIVFSIFIPLKIFSFLKWGPNGLAISTSVYFIISMIIQVILIKGVILKCKM